ncbi:MAG: PEP-CTERM sorting domain-containing protein, partial [Puniceicoccaceae bacterium]
SPKSMKTLPSILLGLVGLTLPLAAQTVVLENSAQSSYTKNSTSASVGSFDSSGGNYLIAIATTGNNNVATDPAVSDITFGDDSFTNLASASIFGEESDRHSLTSVWYLANPTGTDSVTATFSSEADGSGLTVFSVSDAAPPENWLTDTSAGISKAATPDNIELSTSLSSVPSGSLLINGFASTRGLKSIVYTDSLTRDGDLNYASDGGVAYASSISWIEDGSGDYDFSAYLDAGDSGDNYSSTFSAIAVTAIPEPSTFALFAGALGLGLVLLRRRR